MHGTKKKESIGKCSESLELHVDFRGIAVFILHCSHDWWLQIRICDTGVPLCARRG